MQLNHSLASINRSDQNKKESYSNKLTGAIRGERSLPRAPTQWEVEESDRQKRTHYRHRIHFRYRYCSQRDLNRMETESSQAPDFRNRRSRETARDLQIRRRGFRRNPRRRCSWSTSCSWSIRRRR